MKGHFLMLLLACIESRYLSRDNEILASDDETNYASYGKPPSLDLGSFGIELTNTDKVFESNTKSPTQFQLLGKDVQEDSSLRHSVAQYLIQFGYLKAENHTSKTKPRGSIYKDTDLIGGLTRYQELFGLRVTGTVTEETLLKMREARCGLKDEDHSTRNKRYIIKRKLWRKKILRYWFNPRKYSATLPKVVQRSEFVKSLELWSEVAEVTFVEVSSKRRADIEISFESGDHGDKNAFDGKGGVVAHGFFPRKGILHFDADEDFTTDLKKGIDFHSIATHEIGHILGIDHSFLENAIMYPYYGGREVMLHDDDKAAAAAVMGKGRGKVIPLIDLDNHL